LHPIRVVAGLILVTPELYRGDRDEPGRDRENARNAD
jgi:hypothetical protein